MGVHMVGNYIFVSPGQKHYLVASNFTNYFEIGDKSGTKYYLEARIENNEFFVNGRLFIPGCDDPCVIRDNMPTGGQCTKVVLPTGYRVSDNTGRTVIEMVLRQQDLQCNITGIIYDEVGTVVAEGSDNGFTIHHGPAVLGKSGNSRGIVIR